MCQHAVCVVTSGSENLEEGAQGVVVPFQRCSSLECQGALWVGEEGCADTQRLCRYRTIEDFTLCGNSSEKG